MHAFGLTDYLSAARTALQRAFWSVSAVLLLLVSGCASLEKAKPVAPEVSIASVRPLNLSLSGQKLNFTLRVKNPNAFDLPVQSLEFAATLAGKKIAEGVNNSAVTIPANQEAMMDVVVVAGLSTVIEQFKSIAGSLGKDLSTEEGINLDYGVKGAVKLANWPTKFPFDVKGDLADDASKAAEKKLN